MSILDALGLGTQQQTAGELYWDAAQNALGQLPRDRQLQEMGLHVAQFKPVLRPMIWAELDHTDLALGQSTNTDYTTRTVIFEDL